VGSPKLPDALEMEQLLSKAPLKRGFFLRSALLFEHQIVAVSPRYCIGAAYAFLALDRISRSRRSAGTDMQLALPLRGIA
jgi:hypothetical protein